MWTEHVWWNPHRCRHFGAFTIILFRVCWACVRACVCACGMWLYYNPTYILDYTLFVILTPRKSTKTHKRQILYSSAYLAKIVEIASTRCEVRLVIQTHFATAGTNAFKSWWKLMSSWSYLSQFLLLIITQIFNPIDSQAMCCPAQAIGYLHLHAYVRESTTSMGTNPHMLQLEVHSHVLTKQLNHILSTAIKLSDNKLNYQSLAELLCISMKQQVSALVRRSIQLTRLLTGRSRIPRLQIDLRWCCVWTNLACHMTKIVFVRYFSLLFILKVIIPICHSLSITFIKNITEGFLYHNNQVQHSWKSSRYKHRHTMIISVKTIFSCALWRPANFFVHIFISTSPFLHSHYCKLFKTSAAECICVVRQECVQL